MDEEVVIGLFYDAKTNVFTDEDGFCVVNIFAYIRPNDLVLFRFYKKHMIFHHIGSKEVLCELFHSEDPNAPD